MKSMALPVPAISVRLARNDCPKGAIFVFRDKIRSVRLDGRPVYGND